MRAFPGRLCMSEAVPWGQSFNYHSGHPLSVVLQPDYFVSVRNMLRPGDQIRAVHVERNRVRAMIDLLVVEVHNDRVELYQLRDPVEILPTVYTDISAHEYPLAERQITAHIVRLQKLGMI